MAKSKAMFSYIFYFIGATGFLPLIFSIESIDSTDSLEMTYNPDQMSYTSTTENFKDFSSKTGNVSPVNRNAHLTTEPTSFASTVAQNHQYSNLFSTNNIPIDRQNQITVEQNAAIATTTESGNGTWNLLERVRVFDTFHYSYNWSSRFDDRDPDFLFTIVLSMTYSDSYTGSLSFQASGSPITSAMEDFFTKQSYLEDYYFE